MNNYEPVYWGEWADRIVTRYNLKKTGADHYNGPCPQCQGKDRFYISNINNEVKFNCNKGCSFVDIKTIMEEDGVWPIPGRTVLDFPPIKDTNATPFQPLNQKPKHYHERKQIGLNGATLKDDMIVITIINAKGDSVGTQTIMQDGQKRFTSGMAKEGAFSVINGPIQDFAYVTEGWATGCSVSEAMGNVPVIFALDAGNLPKVCEAIQENFPHVRLIVAADNDDKGIDAAKKTGLQYVHPKNTGMDFNDLHVAQGLEEVRRQILHGNQKKQLFTRVGELELKSPEWLIEGMLEKHALAAGFGAPAAGKTFVFLDMALNIAAGRQYHGRKVEQSTVFYIAGEGLNGFARRCKAWSKVNGVDLLDLPFFRSNRAVLFSDEAQVEELRKTIADMIDEFGQPGLICIDTLARAMGADENSTKDMNNYIATCDMLKDEFGCTVLMAHHTGLQEKQRARGSSALLGALDCEFRIERVGDNMTTVEFTKMKDAPEPPKIAFMQVEVDLLTDDGKYVTSIVLEETAAPSKKERDVGDVIFEEYDKIVATEGDKWVSRSVLKCNVALETGKSQRQADRDIKKLIDDQRFVLNNNKLAKG